MRREIVIDARVFDHGLRGLEEAQKSCRLVSQEMEMDVACRIFQVGLSFQDKALVFHEMGQTYLRNIYWMRFTAVGPWWPPVKVLSCFTYF